MQKGSEFARGNYIKPFLKWVGSKHSSLAHILPLLRCSRPGATYFEPFAGSGSVALNVPHSRIVLSDHNPDLVAVWGTLRQHGLTFIDDLRELFPYAGQSSSIWDDDLFKTEQRERYNRLRDEFNTSTNSYRRAMLFIYVNQHSYNGLCRYDKQQKLSITFGMINRPRYPRKELIDAWLWMQRKDLTITLCDFKDSMKRATKGDTIYLDPPYLTESNSIGYQYSQIKFRRKDHDDLQALAQQKRSEGINCVVSNIDCPNVSRLYKGTRIKRIMVRRSINPKHQSPWAELLSY